jgi:hypothetical protein
MEIQKQHKRNVNNLGFTALFVGLIAAQLISIWKLEGTINLNLTDFVLLSLALFRLTRLFVYDQVTQFVRDLFVDITEKKGALERHEKPFGLERALSDIFKCPWCFSIWAGSVFVWAYIMFPAIMLYVALILALSGVATYLQLGANLLGHKAEHEKKIVEKL